MEELWRQAFMQVLDRDTGALGWGLPEPWVHAELYAALRNMAPTSGWSPIPAEVPYGTDAPVRLPGKSVPAAFKYADLCLHTADRARWCWFEAKVMVAGSNGDHTMVRKKCLDAFRKDVAALCAFDVARTAGLWRQENPWAASAWHKRELEPHAARLHDAEHQFVTAFLGIGDGAGDWHEEELRAGVEDWLDTREQTTALPQWKVREEPFEQDGVGGRLVLVTWRKELE